MVLTSQLREGRFGTGNIAEGFGLWHSNEFVRFLLIANGSLKEVETHLLIGNKLTPLSPADTSAALQTASEISK